MKKKLLTLAVAVILVLGLTLNVFAGEVCPRCENGMIVNARSRISHSSEGCYIIYSPRCNSCDYVADIICEKVDCYLHRN